MGTFSFTKSDSGLIRCETEVSGSLILRPHSSLVGIDMKGDTNGSVYVRFEKENYVITPELDTVVIGESTYGPDDLNATDLVETLNASPVFLKANTGNGGPSEAKKKYTCQVWGGTSGAYDNTVGSRTLASGGFIAWKRTSEGVYNGHLAGGFPEQYKTAFVHPGSKDGKFFNVEWLDADNIQITQTDLEGTPVDTFNKFPLEIQTFLTNSYND